jgi:hypothetical protein
MSILLKCLRDLTTKEEYLNDLIKNIENLLSSFNKYHNNIDSVFSSNSGGKIKLYQHGDGVQEIKNILNLQKYSFDQNSLNFLNSL